MGYSIETLTDTDREHRFGTYDTLDAAKEAALRSGNVRTAAAVFASSGTTGGDLVAVYDPNHGWLDVDRVSQPVWWEQVPAAVRDWLVDHPGDALPSWVWVPVVHAGGMAYSVQWNGGDPSGMMLALADEEWLRFQRAVDATQ